MVLMMLFISNWYVGIHCVSTENCIVLGMFAAALQAKIRRRSYADKLEYCCMNAYRGLNV